NGAGMEDWFLGKWISGRRVRKMVCSRIGSNKEMERQYLAGEIEVEFVPQGTFAERIRAGGAGIPAFYTPTGFGTVIADARETREFNGVPCVMEEALVADYSF
ncbi:MAG: CoA-transferase, partial [Nitrospinota bacterium]|nr:CoA-transferase [Nitrospinota bacterium]